MDNMLQGFIKASGNQLASVVDDGVESDVTGFLDTGSYTFNALLSGSLYGGMPNNKILALAGESATGKTFFAIGMVSKFLADNPEGVVLYFDSEQAVTSSMFKERNVDSSRIAVFPVGTVEEFRHQCLQILDNYKDQPADKKKPMLIVLDSLGMLSTSKEIRDTAEGKEVRDMTRAQVVKSTFRTLTLKLGALGIPLIMTNHTYDVVGCLSDDIDVLMADGSSKNITEISVGDKVKTLTGDSEVTELFEYNVDETIEVEMEDGSIFRCTSDHKFMTSDGTWKSISDIREGEDIVSVEHFSQTTIGNV